MQSASASQAHFRTIHIWPDWPGADLEAACLMSGSINSLSTFSSWHGGCGGGSSWKCISTFRGSFLKNLCESKSATSSCEWTKHSGPLKEGTLETLWPCLHAATSQRLDFSMYSFAHCLFTAHTAPLRRACAVFRASLFLVLRRF